MPHSAPLALATLPMLGALAACSGPGSCPDTPKLTGTDAQSAAAEAEWDLWKATTTESVCVREVRFRSLDSAPHKRGYRSGSTRIYLSDDTRPADVSDALRRELCVAARDQTGLGQGAELISADAFANLCVLGAAGVEPLRTECPSDVRGDVLDDVLTLYRPFGSSAGVGVELAHLDAPDVVTADASALDDQGIQLAMLTGQATPAAAWVDVATGDLREPSAIVGRAEEPPAKVEGWPVLRGDSWPGGTVFHGKLAFEHTKAERSLLLRDGVVSALECVPRRQQTSVEVDGELLLVWIEDDAVRWAPIQPTP